MEVNETYSAGLLSGTAAGAFLISIVGTTGNLLVVVALVQNATLRQNPSTAFMVNLPACLLPVCAIGMPMFAVGCIQQQLYGKVLIPEHVIVALFALGLILSQVHIHTICALAFNRLVAVMWPAKYRQLIRQRKVYLGVLWLYSVLLWLPIACGGLGGLKFEEEELMAAIDNSEGKVLKAIHVFFTYMLPIVFIATCYISMYLKVKYSKRSRQVRASRKIECGDEATPQWDDHVTRTILVIFIFMVICCVPHLVIHIKHLYKRQPATWLLLHLVFWLQFCLDPLVYVIISSQYRAACIETGQRLVQCLGLSSGSEYCLPKPFSPNVQSIGSRV